MIVSRLALIGLATLVLSACATSRSGLVAAKTEVLRVGKVAEVDLVDRPADLKVTPEFDNLFEQHVKTRLDRCAKGDRPLKVEAKITRLTKANPIATTLVVGANTVIGEARIVDVATGEVVGEFAINHRLIGSRLGYLFMAQAEEQMSNAFGNEVCKQAFPRKRN